MGDETIPKHEKMEMGGCKQYVLAVVLGAPERRGRDVILWFELSW